MSVLTTLDKVELQTHYALVGAIGVRVALREEPYHELWKKVDEAADALKAAVAATTIDLLEDVEPEDAERLVGHLQELHTLITTLLKRLSDVRWPAGVANQAALDKLQEGAEALGDLLESYYLSRNPDFQQMIGEAIQQLGSATDRPSDWRSALARVQNRR
jgi:hypothetical protein